MENENIVKKTCKELGVTQKELADNIGVTEDAVSKWARGHTETPKYAKRLFELLATEKKFNTIKRIISDELN